MKKKLLLFALILGVFTSCVDNNEEAVKRQEIDNAISLFNFATTKAVSLSISYDVTFDYKIMFKVYGENPYIKKDGQVQLNNAIEPIAVGFTDDKGNFNDKVTIPSTVEQVYVYSYYIDVPHLLKATLTGDAVSVTPANAIDPAAEFPNVRSRAYATTVDYKSYTTWNSNGRIDANDRISIDALSDDVKQTINNLLPESRDNRRFALAADFYISEPANVNIRYIDGATSARSTFGYYCYKGNTPPSDPSLLNRIVIFPNANKDTNGISGNDAVKLMYYDEATGKFSDEFPKGYTLGFFIVNDGGSQISTGKFIEGYGTFYSKSQYNSDGRTHTAAFDIKQDGKDTTRVFSIEDWTDNDYNDIIFTLQANPITALGPVPEVDTDQEEQVISMTYKGIIAFEDLWPSKGDFDLNDVVYQYQSQIYIGEKDNKVIRTEDKFTLLWSGAGMDNGFGYMLNVPRSNIESVTIDSKHTFAGQGLESDTQEAIIMIMDKSKTATVGNTVTVPTTVKTVFKNRVSISELGAAPYNPFIVSSGHIEKNRKEIHMVDYKPTSKANMSFFGTKDDISFPTLGLYYRTKQNYPFAIQLPNITEFSTFLNPKFEGKVIDQVFPRYNDWVSSKGTQNKDWYNHPAK